MLWIILYTSIMSPRNRLYLKYVNLIVINVLCMVTFWVILLFLSFELFFETQCSTRGNKYKLQNHNFHYSFRKFSFAARVANVWNSLPDHVVDVNSLKQFETKLDKFWRDQDVMFDWTAEITGAGDRSEFKLETVLESTI